MDASRWKRIIGILFILMVIFIFVLIVFRDSEKPEYSEKVIWQAQDGINYRVPGIIVTEKGTVISYCEMRQGVHDRSVMSVVYKRSDAGGENWSENIVLADGFATNQIISDPLMVVGNNNRIHCFYCVDNAKEWKGGWVAYVFSDDDGLTWSLPKDISVATNPKERGLFATGPGHGICLKDGTIIIPIWLSYNRKEDGDDSVPCAPGTLYSQDNGKTWLMGDIIPESTEDVNFNECTVVELSNGSVMMIIRNDMYNNWFRAMSVSPNGYSDWSNPVLVNTLKSPHCYGSLCAANGSILYISPLFDELNPDSRDKTIIRASYDDGKSWETKRLIVNHDGGYADINYGRSSKNDIYALAELHDGNSFSIRFHRFNFAWLNN